MTSTNAHTETRLGKPYPRHSSDHTVYDLDRGLAVVITGITSTTGKPPAFAKLLEIWTRSRYCKQHSSKTNMLLIVGQAASQELLHPTRDSNSCAAEAVDPASSRDALAQHRNVADLGPSNTHRTQQRETCSTRIFLAADHQHRSIPLIFTILHSLEKANTFGRTPAHFFNKGQPNPCTDLP